MIRRFLNWLASRKRRIYRFYDGKTWRGVDPYLTWNSLKSDPEFSLEHHPVEVDRGDHETTMKLFRAVHRAFGTKEFDGNSGITVEEAVEIFYRFMIYVDLVKKNSVMTPTSSPTTDGEHSEGQSQTSDGSESSSTHTVLEFGEDTEL